MTENEALAAWLTWNNQIPDTIKPLHSGSSHHTFHVSFRQQQFFLKLLNEHSTSLLPDGTSPETLHNLSRLLASKTIAPHTFLCNHQLQLSEYIHGQTWPNNATPEQLILLANTLRELHSIDTSKLIAGRHAILSNTLPTLNIEQHIVRYHEQLNHYATGKHFIAEHFPSLSSALTIIRRQNESHVICHQDLHPGNIIITERRCLFVDWEYACLNDRHMDLASLAEYFNFSPEQLTLVWQHYNPSLINPDLLRIYGIVLRYLECLWWLLKNSGIIDKNFNIALAVLEAHLINNSYRHSCTKDNHASGNIV